MTKQERMLAYTFYFLILIGGAALVVFIFKVFVWGPALLSSVSWNGGVV
jgi:hypothetical protein